MPLLKKEDKLRLLTTIIESRHGDLREENLNRQGKGHFHVSGMGHEALAAISFAMEPDDYACPYYRDRGFVLGRGVTTRELALEYMAKRKSSSGGRQMPSHYSHAPLHLWSVPTPTGAQLLPACGMAWGMQLDGKKNLVVTTVGDAATRQGDFFEAVCFAKERKLPVLFVVEDNGYGISSPTRNINPLVLGVLQPNEWQLIDGFDVQKVYDATVDAMEHLRSGKGPVFFWAKMERLSSHTSSDDQKLYRSAEELGNLEKGDPLKVWKDRLIEEGVISNSDFEKLDQEIKERIRQEYIDAEKEENPLPNELEVNVTKTMPELDQEILQPGKYRIGDTINKTLRFGLEKDSRRVIFGEDVQDPKGGVFRLTQKLSTDFPAQVFNSPLAESTILGVACGLASYGKRPVFELQFIDFIYPGWNQLVTNLSTLRWRSFGKWTCPAVIYAPYGAYLPGGSLWHSQANESALAHFPGLCIVVPSTPEDAAGLLWTAMHSEDPVIFLIPKHMLWAERETKEAVRAVPFGQARKRTTGSDVTVVAWGNTVEKSLEALKEIDDEISVELIDLRTIVPWDHAALEESVRKTGRLIVVQEDTENCSVGQMIIAHLTEQSDVWSEMVSPPILVSKGNVMIGYNPIYEYAALPDTQRIVAALRRSISTKSERMTTIETRPSETVPTKAPAKAAPSQERAQNITVPIMGEGIRSAKVVALLKQPGDRIELDDALCEVETDKAVYPIESSFAGTMGEWKTKVEDTVEIGQEIGTILAEGGESWSDQVEAATETSPVEKQNGAAETELVAAGVSPANRETPARIEPALSPTIVRRLGRVIPANLQIDARWEAIRNAREAAKKSDGKNAPSPSVMVAWAVVRAMEKHASFRRLMLDDDRIVESDDFDLGIAVAIEGDRLATAVVTQANRADWPEFVRRYNETVDETRKGRVDAMNAPIVISSLGAFGVRAAAPIVVPPSVGTLFVGSAHQEMIANGKKAQSGEVITLSLTFDHRVVNGAGAANFVRDIANEIERFEIPAPVAASATPSRQN
jgi:2-oxoisovalerate dehydrogenase E1 component